ncbi:hypothetical protein E8E13_001242 [Curvularia kusanoi]|uniref:Uncharacterized protein n=1 Tax=Curvularia kusanoi TaxID=90978 RepID=A0A9P4W7E7_CURKU|nr:hypothetical protein E8E13_001242 [Curvularia kusanoi]
MQSVQAVAPVRFGGPSLDRTQQDAHHKIQNSNAVESNLAPVFETGIVLAEPCDSSKIIATSGNCLVTNYSSPLYYGDRINLAFARDLYLALCQLSQTNTYRRRLYGDEADESRFNHTPPETRARYLEVLRRDSVHSQTVSAPNTPQFEREMSECFISDASSQSTSSQCTSSNGQEPASTPSQNCRSLCSEGRTVHQYGKRDACSESTSQPSVDSFTQSQWSL